jgi:hypothetical protein
MRGLRGSEVVFAGIVPIVGALEDWVRAFNIRSAVMEGHGAFNVDVFPFSSFVFHDSLVLGIAYGIRDIVVRLEFCIYHCTKTGG